MTIKHIFKGMGYHSSGCTSQILLTAGYLLLAFDGWDKLFTYSLGCWILHMFVPLCFPYLRKTNSVAFFRIFLWCSVYFFLEIGTQGLPVLVLQINHSIDFLIKKNWLPVWVYRHWHHWDYISMWKRRDLPWWLRWWSNNSFTENL